MNDSFDAMSESDSGEAAAARVAGSSALKRLSQFHEYSSLSKQERNDILELEWSDLELGSIVGRGAFSNIYSVTLLPSSSFGSSCPSQRPTVDWFLSDSFEDDDEGGREEDQTRQQQETDASQPPEYTSCFDLQPRKKYALKCLKEHVMENEASFERAAIDLALEGQLLSRLQHRNIIRLHGVTSGGVSASFCDHDGGFFLVLDLLVNTLDKKLGRWQELERSVVGHRFFWPRRGRPHLQMDRIENVILGIAMGLEYLHSNNIMFRDIKPANIGFDENDTVRIFDFGFAREIFPHQRDQSGRLRQLTGEAGTPRYMAPEVVRREGFDCSSDVYSFAILAWEICTLERPFQSIKSNVLFDDRVVYGKCRPSLKRICFPAMRDLLEQAWDDDPRKRPSMQTVRETLQDIIMQDAQKPHRACHFSFLHRATPEFSSAERRNSLDHGVIRQLSILSSNTSRRWSSASGHERSEQENVEEAQVSSFGPEGSAHRSASSTNLAAEAMAERLAHEVKKDSQFLQQKTPGRLQQLRRWSGSAAL